MADSLKICLVIGYPVSHSLSPIMHNTAYKALKIDSQYIFRTEKVAPGDLENAIERFRKQKIHALAITIPHKESIIKYLDEIDLTAKEIGAVNTVVNNNGILKGYNTDWKGAMNALGKQTLLRNKKVAILGSGGTARAIAYGLLKKKCELTFFCRNKYTAMQIARQFKCKTSLWEERKDATNSTIIINTTPLGRDDNESPLSYNDFSKNHVVFDINYQRGGTFFITFAGLKKAKTIDGLEMLLQQGMLQFELYTGLKAPEKAMREALEL